MLLSIGDVIADIGQTMEDEASVEFFKRLAPYPNVVRLTVHFSKPEWEQFKSQVDELVK